MDNWVKETEACPRRTYSSSSTKCFDHIFDHDLCKNGYLKNVLQKKALNLLNLKIPSANRPNGYQLDLRSGAGRKDRHVGEYVECLIPLGLTDVIVSVDKDLDEFQHLSPFLHSVENRPDVVFLKGGLPLLIVEVQSSLFKQSVCKTVVDLIDQLRLLRNYSTDISQCTGFTFPEFKGMECVAKVHVEWKDFSFHVDYTPLTLADDVQSEVSQAITESLKNFDKITRRECHRFFIALSDEELHLVGAHVGDEIQCQVCSRQSIVLQGTSHFWKYNPDPIEREKLLFYYMKTRRFFHAHEVKCLKFFGIERYERPLSRQDAKRCLYSLVTKVMAVLRHFHDMEKIAHLDVRLENICFKLPDTVVMIDLDRYMSADDRASLDLTYASVMYSGNDGWLCENLDWKQLGLMINWLISDDHAHYDYHAVDFSQVEDPFLKALLFEGQFTI